MLVDPFELIKKAPAGLMSYGMSKEKLEDDLSFIFLVKEEAKYIKKIGYNPVFQIRVGLIKENNVVAILVMVKVNNNDDMLYDCWLNHHQSGSRDGEEIRTLANQENIIFKFYDSQECKRTIAIPNSLRSTLTGYVSQIEQYPKWTMAQFDQLKNSIYSKYTTGQQLWASLRGEG